MVSFRERVRQIEAKALRKLRHSSGGILPLSWIPILLAEVS
jgi:DNA-directed RNA polymerase sigma subunit (sigma70/sigma32)